MTFDQAVLALKNTYSKAGSKSKVVAIHLFAIENAEALNGHPLTSLAEAATGHSSYGTELRKGINLAPFVEIKRKAN